MPGTDSKTMTKIPATDDSMNNMIAVHDFADTSAVSSSESASVASILTPLSTIAESSSANTSPFTTKQSDDLNTLSYSRFYDPSWTLLSAGDRASALPALEVVQIPFQHHRQSTAIRIENTADEFRHNRHQSAVSVESRYSTYSTYPATVPKHPPGGALQTVESGVEIDIRSSTTKTGREKSGTVIHARHDSDRTTSSTYSTYST